jgi:hypothetical protein
MKSIGLVIGLVVLLALTSGGLAQMPIQSQQPVGAAPTQQIQQSIYQFIKSSPQTSRVCANSYICNCFKLFNN